MLEIKYKKSIVSIFLVILILFSSCLSVFADNANSTNGNSTIQTINEEKADRILNLVVGQSYTFVFDGEAITNCTTEDSGIVGAFKNGNIYGIDYGSTNVTVTTNCNKYTYTVNVIKKELTDSAVFFYPTDTHKIETKNVFPDGTEENQGLFPEPEYKFVSSDTNVATVSEDGTITAVSIGKTTVAVEFGAKSNTLLYDVFVEEPTLNTNSATINNAGGKIKIEVNCGLNQKITYHSNDSAIATVDNKGNVTGLKKGVTNITVKVDSTVLNFKVTVKNNPKLSVSNKNIYVNQTFILRTIGAVGKVKYASSNKKVATINKKGAIKGIGKGTCTITATVNGVKLNCKITVCNPLLNYNSKNIYLKKKFVLKVNKGLLGKATFKSEDKKIATVTSNGVVQGKKRGVTNIIVTANGVKLKCKVTVNNPKLNYKSKKITEGKYFKLKVTGGKGKIPFKSNNKKIATVSKYGKVKAKRPGTCKIIVKRNGVKLVCKVTVNESKFPVGYSLSFKQKSKSIKRHKYDTFNISSYFEKTDNAKKLYEQKKCTEKQYKYVNTQHLFKFESSNTKIASISPNGKIVAKNKGTCTITVTLYTGKKYNYTLTVLNPLNEKTLKNGKKVKFVYSEKELLEAFYNDTKNYLIKGLKSPYYGYACKYDNNYKLCNDICSQTVNIEEKLCKKYKSFMETARYILGNIIESVVYKQEVNSKIFVINNYSFDLIKKSYDAALNIINDLNLNKYDTTNEKVVTLFNYLAKNIKYGYGERFYDAPCIELNTLLSKTGVCSDSAVCANYICALLGIECYSTVSDKVDHEMNVVKADNGKYYFCDCTANGVGAAMWTGTRQLQKVNLGWKEFTDFALRNFGISVSPRSYPYLDDEAKECFGEINVEFLEWKYWDYEYICDEEILKSLGITPVD